MPTLDERIFNHYQNFGPDPGDDPAETLRKKILGKYGLNPTTPPKYMPLPESEAAGLKDQLLGAGGSVLGFIGGTIDKIGFRQLRALASGHVEDIPRSLIPFGGTLGLDDQSHNLTWDDIMTGKGRIVPQVIKENDPTSWEARDFVGPLMDTFIGPRIPKFFAPTQYGRAAQATASMPRTLAQGVRGFADDVAGLASRAPASPLPMNRYGGMADPRTMSQRVLEGLSDTPRTAEQYTRHPVYQPIAPQTFTEEVARRALPAYTPGTPLRAAVELGIPFGPSWQFGTGPRSMRIAEMMSGASDKLQFGRNITPQIRNPVPFVRNLFDAGTGNALEPEVQFSNLTQAVPIRRSIQETALTNEAAMRRSLEQTMQAHGLQGHDDVVNSYLRDRAEGLPLAQNMPEWIDERLVGQPFRPHPAAHPLIAASGQLQGLGDQIGQTMQWVKQQSQAHGLPFHDLVDEYVNYVLRRTPETGAQSWQQSVSQRIWNALTGSNIKRKIPLKDQPSGSEGINRFSVDPRVSGPNATLSPDKAQTYIIQKQLPDALRAYRQNLPTQDLLDRFLPKMGYPQLSGIAGEMNQPGLAAAIGSREGQYATQGLQGLPGHQLQPAIVQTARPRDLAPFTRILPANAGDLLLSRSNVESLLAGKLPGLLGRGPASGGPSFNQLSELARLADPQAARALIAQQSSQLLGQQVPGLIGGMSVSNPAVGRRYAQILEHPTIAPAVENLWSTAPRRQALEHAFNVSTQGQPMGQLERMIQQTMTGRAGSEVSSILGKYDPLELKYVQDTLAQRLRGPIGRRLQYGQEAAIRSRIDPAALLDDFLQQGGMNTLEDRTKPFAKIMRELAPEHAAQGKALFDRDPLNSVQGVYERYGKAMGAHSGSFDLVRRTGRPVSDFPGGAGEYMPAQQFSKGMSASNYPAFRSLTVPEQITLNAAGFNSADELRTLLDQADLGNPLAVRRAATVPRSLAAAVRQQNFGGADAEMLRALGHHGFPDPASGERFTAQDVITRRNPRQQFVPSQPQPGAGPHQPVVNLAPQLPPPPTADAALKEFGIPSELAREALANQVRHLVPHEIQPFANTWDSLQQLYKAMLYPIWPASQIRNYVGGMYNNWATDSFDPRFGRFDPRRYLQPQRDMANLLRGRNIDPLPQFAHLAPEEARLATIESLYGNRIAFQEGMFNELGDQGNVANPGRLRSLVNPGPAPSVASLAAANVRGSFAPYANLLRGRGTPADWEAIKPWAIRGFGNRTEDVNSLIRASRQVGGASEDMLRGGQGIGLMRQGFTPSAAGQMVRKTHFDYRDLSATEKDWFRRFLPFYTFSRKNLPEQAGRLFSNPEKSGKTIQMFQNLRGNDYLPSFMGGGFALPLGQEDDTGNQRFLSQTGLPIEEAFEKLKLTNRYGIPVPDWRKTAMEYMGLLNPAIKGPLEQLFGYQFFTGRRLSDLKPTGVGTLGGYLEGENAQWLSQLLANTPASRFISTIDKMRDPRKTGVSGMIAKGLNLGTGLKVSDVDMERSRNMDIRNALEEAMRRDPSISTFLEAYIPPDKFADAQANRPDTMQLMRLFSQMKAEARRKAAERREHDRLLNIQPMPAPAGMMGTIRTGPGTGY